MNQVPIIMPDLDLGDQLVTASSWLVTAGQQVVQGDRLLELAAGDVTVDLPAPATGQLVECSVIEGQTVTTEQVLGTILIQSGPDFDAPPA